MVGLNISPPALRPPISPHCMNANVVAHALICHRKWIATRFKTIFRNFDILDLNPMIPMKKIKQILSFCTILLISGSCANQAKKTNDQNAETVKYAVEGLHQQAVSAVNRGDLAELMSVYTEDVISMPEGQDPLIGKAAVQQMWKNVLENYAVHVTVTTEEVQYCNDLAFERGTFEMTLNPKAGGQAINNTGKYLDILRNLPDGKWKYFRVSFSSNKPSGT